jgi:hypothetical protein
MDEALLLDLAQIAPDMRVFEISDSSPSMHHGNEQAFEYLVVVPECLRMKVFAMLTRHAGKHRLDVGTLELFDRSPPSYFDRCRELPVNHLLAAARPRESEIRTREAERLRREAENLRHRVSLRTLVATVITTRAAVASAFEAVVRPRFGDAQVSAVGSPDVAAWDFDERLDCALVDGSSSEEIVAAAIGSLQAILPSGCIAVLVTSRSEEPPNAVRESGVSRVVDIATDTDQLLDAANRRRIARLARS